MSIRILKSIFICIFLCSSAFFAASDVLDRSPQSSLFEGASGIGSGITFGTSGKELGPTADFLQFEAGGHVLGFRKGQMCVASGDHALSVEYVNARPVSPAEKTAASNPEKNPAVARSLGKVAYNDLWDGVTLVYENHGAGVVTSSYLVEAGGIKAVDRVDQIRLRYNVPVKVDEAGDLILAFKTGEMREARPVAWQEIGGNRVPVEVAYRLKNGQDVGFKAGSYDSQYSLAIDLVLSWNTFLGGSGADVGWSIAVDTSGNVYVTGYSNATWGSPMRPFVGGTLDAFVAKLDANGALQWNTFLGGAANDFGYGIAVDSSGNVYVNGESYATWGSPLRPFAGGYDAFVVKLNNSGVLQWNTFLGGSGIDQGWGIASDTGGNVYVTGFSYTTWGSPIRPYGGGTRDAFVAKLSASGVLQWNTFLGGSGDDLGFGIAVDSLWNVYVAGESDATWGSPVRPHSGGLDAFVVKVDANGGLQWNTFLGGSGDDYGFGIAVDTGGKVYVSGKSIVTWGSPIRPYAGGSDAFVAQLNANGAMQWNTFLGGSGDDFGYGLATDASGNVFATGLSSAAWGSPIRPSGGSTDAFVVKLNASGALQWNAFLGGSNADTGYMIATDTSGGVYITGESDATWGSPVRSYAGGQNEALVAKVKEVVSYNLTIASGSHGTTNPAPGTYSYASGSNVSVSAVADEGYAFDRWTGDVSGGQETSATVSIPMTADKSIQANFIKVLKPPLSLTGERLVNRSVLMVEYVARLQWQANPVNTGTVTYRIYQIENGQAAEIGVVGSGTLEYFVRKLQMTKSYQFGVTTVNSLGWESDMAVVSVQ